MYTTHPFQRSNGEQQSFSLAFLLGSTFLLLGLLLSGCSNGLSQKPASSPSTSKAIAPLTAIQMLDPQQGWALTETSILQTRDGGVHWKDVSPANGQHIGGLRAAFLNASTAWVTTEMNADGYLHVLRTTDGGNHWDSTILSQIYGNVIGGPDFINLSNGWVEVSTGAATGNEWADIYRTTDGGKTWARVSSTTSRTGRSPGHLPWSGEKSGISFLDAQTGWATGAMHDAPNVFWFYVTHDGGVSWRQQNLAWPAGLVNPTATMMPPVFFGKDGLLPVLIGDPTTHPLGNLDLYVTRDGGVSWQSSSLAAPYPRALFPNIMTAPDRNHIWIPDAPNLAVTSDGGQHWNQITPKRDFTNISALDFLSNGVGWAIGGLQTPQSLLLKTTDGGQVWTEIPYSIS